MRTSNLRPAVWLRHLGLFVGSVSAVSLGCTSQSEPTPSNRAESFPSFAGVWKAEDDSRLNITVEGKVTGGLYWGGIAGFDRRFLSIGGVVPARLRQGESDEEAYFEMRVLDIDVSKPAAEKEPDPSKADTVRVDLKLEGTATRLRLNARGKSGSRGLVFDKQP